MRTHKNLIYLGLAFLMAALGWYFLGVIERPGEIRGRPPSQTNGDIAKGAHPDRSALDAGRHQNSALDAVVPEAGKQIDMSSAVEAARAVPVPEPSQPGINLPPDIRPGGAFEVAPEAGIMAPRRMPGVTQPQPVITPPPGVRPEDVEISPEAGLIVPTRAPGLAPVQPSSSMTAPRVKEGGIVLGSDTAGIQKSQPNGKEPVNTPTAPPPKK